MKLAELLNTEHKDQILAILNNYGQRMNCRRDRLRWFIRDNGLKVIFSMSEMKELINQPIN